MATKSIAQRLLALGLAILLLPFNNTRSGSVTREVVTVEKQELLNHDEIISQYPGVEIIESNTILINEPQLKSVKREIALKFEHYAPVELIEKIKVLMNKW